MPAWPLAYLAERVHVTAWDDLHALVRGTRSWEWSNRPRGVYIGYHSEQRVVFISSADLNAIDKRLQPAMKKLQYDSARDMLLPLTWKHWHEWPYHQPQRYLHVKYLGLMYISAVTGVLLLQGDQALCDVTVTRITGDLVCASDRPLQLWQPVTWLESLYPGCIPTITQALHLGLTPDEVAAVLDTGPTAPGPLPALPHFDYN